VYDFLRGLKNIDEVEIRVVVWGHKVKITHEVIFDIYLFIMFFFFVYGD
jgi:hypothetical protein